MSTVLLKHPVQEVESFLHRFYFNVLYRSFKLESTDFVEVVKKSLRGKCDRSHNLNLDYISRVHYKEADHRCAYMYEFSVLHSAVVIHHFLQLLKYEENLIERLVSSESFEICCLGGRSIPEAVGICKIVSDILEKHEEQRSSPLVLKIRVVNLCKGWSTDIWKLQKLLRKDPDLCNPKKIKLTFQFLEGDLTKFHSERIINAIRKSDLITIVKFISELILPTKAESPNKTLVRSVIKEIFRNMKEESYLFFLDNSEGGYSDIVEKGAQLYSNFKLKQALLREVYTLDIDSLRHETEYLYHTFEKLCKTHIIVSSGTWKKVKLTRDTPSCAKLPQSKIRPSSNSNIEDILKKQDQNLIKAH
ncbi:uncharacterized protein LOC118191926 isoform X2 [Stegodyphus dumicola]|uniref:uncharacterized protein LOC118191926 isoform X2 n=1 Tax=Stegodyphus dumicola TaxID=202533 RepID=UPI0015AB615B|nr:uncharacterized protein LOC118191926 isoform X2 [Stegodyphus dumicola]